MHRLALLALPLLLVVCTPVPSPSPPAPDAGDAGLDAALSPEAVHVCEAFRRLGCAEGAPSCEATIAKVLGSTVTRFDAGCVIGATTKEAARRCPGVLCP